jgi:L,D-transpeptidase YcbB
VRTSSIVGVVLALAVGPALAQVSGQPTLLDPRPAVPNPQLTPPTSTSAPAGPQPLAPANRPAAAKPPPAASANPSVAAKPPPKAKSREGAKAPSTPESRSAAALALSADPVFDEGTYQRIKEALFSYAAIQVRGGWPTLPAETKLALGAIGPDVAALRRRLVISDDLAPEQEQGDTYDAAVAEAIKRFQVRHGLDPTGSINAPTLRALNVPVATRMKQLEASLERLRGMDFVFAERYVVVNIPAAFVEAVSNDKVERRYRVIVGKVDKPSPTLTAYITAINLNPTWTVPLSITKNEIISRMRRDPTYLSRMHMRVLGGRDEEIDPQAIDWSSDRSPNFTIRQDSGGFNALGNLKIDMPNPYSVYMHDTTTRNLFANDYRFDSHGCTRVDNVRDLAAWIMEDMPGWNRAAIDAGISTGVLKVVNLPRKMPVAWVYLTGWVTRDGTVQFREDVYKHDEGLDRDKLDETVRAGGFVAPMPRDVKQVSNLDSR